MSRYNMKHFRVTIGVLVVILATFIFAAISLQSSYGTTLCPEGEHVYEVTIIKLATETEEGLRQYTCTVCGHTYEEVIPPRGHVWQPWVVDKEPTCTMAGVRHRTCVKDPSNPHSEKEEIPALGHDYKLSKRVNSTVDTEGFEEYKCSRCGDTYTVSLPKLIAPIEENKEPEKTPPAPPVAGSENENGGSSGEGSSGTAGEGAGSESPSGETTPIEGTEGQGGQGFLGLGIDVNVYDVVFVGAIGASSAGFTLLILPFVAVLQWGSRKKKEINLRRAGGQNVA